MPLTILSIYLYNTIQTFMGPSLSFASQLTCCPIVPSIQSFARFGQAAGRALLADVDC